MRYQLQRQGGEFVLTEPKSASGRRTIALPGFAITALQAHAQRQRFEQRAARGAWNNALGLVFVTELGHPLHRRNVLRQFQNDILKPTDLPLRGLKELRHSAASLLHLQGASPREIMEVLGHSDIAITLGTYTHVWDKQRVATAARMDEWRTAGS